MTMVELLIQYIIVTASLYQVSPEIAVSVAMVESNLNPEAIGSLGEIGLFQVRPEFSELTREQLRNPYKNIEEGLRILQHAKKKCLHKSDYDFLVCYNAGVAKGNKIKAPKQFAYIKKISRKLSHAKKQVSKLKVSARRVRQVPVQLQSSHTGKGFHGYVGHTHTRNNNKGFVLFRRRRSEDELQNS